MAHGPDHPVTLECERLIWSLNPTALSEQPTSDGDTWAGSVQAEVVRHGMAAPLSSPTRPHAPYPTAAAILMAKDEDDIIGANLRWLYFVGFRRFVMLDNNSSDGTADIIRLFRHEFSDVELVTVQDPLVRYMQAEKTTGLYRLALSIWPDLRWVFPIDADEFLVPGRGLAALEEVPAQIDALTIPKVIHFRNIVETGQTQSSFFQRMSYRSPLFVVPPKIVARNNLFVTITQGNHKIRLVDERHPTYSGGFEHGFYFREFPTRSFEQLMRKVRNGGQAILAAEAFLGRPVGGEHWKDYYAKLSNGGEQELLNIYRQDWIKDPALGLVHDPFEGWPTGVSDTAPADIITKKKFSVGGTAASESVDEKPVGLKIGLLAVIHNEQRLIGEFIAHHIGLGFNRIHLFDNNSMDHTRPIIEQASRAYPGISVETWNGSHVEAFARGVEMFRDEIDWLFAADCDEFIVSPDGNDLNEFLTKMGAHAAIGLHWATFGSSGLVADPDELLTTRLLRRAPDDIGLNHHVKSIVRPRYVQGVINTHAFALDRQHFPYVNCRAEPLHWLAREGLAGNTPVLSPFRVNRYFCRFRTLWDAKVANALQGSADGSALRTENDWIMHDRNEVLDTSALQYASRTRQIMAKMGLTPPYNKEDPLGLEDAQARFRHVTPVIQTAEAPLTAPSAKPAIIMPQAGRVW